MILGLVSMQSEKTFQYNGNLKKCHLSYFYIMLRGTPLSKKTFDRFSRLCTFKVGPVLGGDGKKDEQTTLAGYKTQVKIECDPS
jgi:hypothetical protein